MTDLKSQRRIAAKVLKVGQNRVWINPEGMEDTKAAMTREEIKKLIHEDTIRSLPEKGVSHARARIIREKKRKRRRCGAGSRSGASHAKISKKEAWMCKIRALRKRLRLLKANKIVTENTYRKMYRLASSGRFASVADLERYMKAQNLWRKR